MELKTESYRKMYSHQFDILDRTNFNFVELFMRKVY